jgi:hypothetical protein
MTSIFASLSTVDAINAACILHKNRDAVAVVDGMIVYEAVRDWLIKETPALEYKRYREVLRFHVTTILLAQKAGQDGFIHPSLNGLTEVNHFNDAVNAALDAFGVALTMSVKAGKLGEPLVLHARYDVADGLGSHVQGEVSPRHDHYLSTLFRALLYLSLAEPSDKIVMGEGAERWPELIAQLDNERTGPFEKLQTALDTPYVNRSYFAKRIPNLRKAMELRQRLESVV